MIKSPLAQYLTAQYLPLATTFYYSITSNYVMNGYRGAAIGALSNIFDQYLISFNITEKYYASMLSYWYFVLKPVSLRVIEIFPTYKVGINLSAFSLIGVFVYYGDDFFNFSANQKLSSKSFVIVEKIFAKNLTPLHNVMMINFGSDLSNMILDICFSWSLSKYAHGLFINKFISDHKIIISATHAALFKNELDINNPCLKDFQDFLIKGASIIVQYIVKDKIQYFIKNHRIAINDQFQLELLIEADDLFTNKTNHEKIIQHPAGQEILKNYADDLTKIWLQGAIKFNNNMILNIIKSLIDHNYINRLLPEAAPVYYVLLGSKQWFLGHYIIETRNIESELAINQKHINDAQKHSISKDKNLLHTQISLSTKKKIYSLHQEQISKHYMHLSEIMDLFYFSYKYANNKLKIEDMPFLKFALSDQVAFLSRNIYFAEQEMMISSSLNNINLLFEIINNQTLYASNNSVATVTTQKNIGEITDQTHDSIAPPEKYLYDTHNDL